jgi:KDO2-lipid IV(A) lauroyltransferase
LAKDLKENQSITQYYADMLEQKIMEQPEIWLWSHKRWKHKKQ